MSRFLAAHTFVTFLIILTFLFILTPDISFARVQFVKSGVKYSDEIKYRDIYAKTAPELVKRMKQLVKDRRSKRTGFAWAKPEFSWRTYWDKGPGSCGVSNVLSTVHVTFTLPRWVNKATADKKLQYKWEVFLDNIKYYEIGYAEIARDTAKKIERELKKIKTNACSATGKKANKRGYEILDELGDEYRRFHTYAKRQKRYMINYNILLNN